jgi:CDP-diacylglycerol--glycerol-3-phosphate 3-phosphatidyltransferase
VLIIPIFLLRANALQDREILCLYLLAFITDYLDGAVARSLGTATRPLRIADSSADTFFHLSLVYVLLRHHPAIPRGNIIPLIAFGITVAAWYLLDALRWHRPAGFHAFSSKLFSFAIMLWIVALLNHLPATSLLTFALAIGCYSNIEGILTSLSLPLDRTDVWWVGQLWRRRPSPDQPQISIPSRRNSSPVASAATLPFGNT